MNNVQNREDQIVVVIPPTPWVTIMLIIFSIFGYYVAQTGGAQFMHSNAFSCEKYFSQTDLLPSLQYTLFPTFYQINIIHLLASMYFIWVFGSTMELRLGNIVTAVIVLISIVTGWTVLAQFAGPVSLPLYVGPAFLTCALLGGYLILMPVKKTSAFGTHMPKYTYRLYARQKDKDPTAGFGVSPWMIVFAFITYLVVMHLYLGKIQSEVQILQPIPCLVDLLLGFVITITVVMMITQSVEANPMKALARKKYRELRALDMTHVMAVNGTALSLGVPDEKIEEWLGTGKHL